MLSDEELDRISERSKNDKEIFVGSDIRTLVNEAREANRLRAEKQAGVWAALGGKHDESLRSAEFQRTILQLQTTLDGMRAENERLRGEVDGLKLEVEEADAMTEACEKRAGLPRCACMADRPDSVCMVHSPAIDELRIEMEKLRTPFDLDLEDKRVQQALAVYEGDLLGLCNSTLFDVKVSERVCAALWERQERLRSKAEKYDKLVEVASSIPSIQTDPSPSHWVGGYERLRKKSDLADKVAENWSIELQACLGDDWLRCYEEANADV